MCQSYALGIVINDRRISMYWFSLPLFSGKLNFNNQNDCEVLEDIMVSILDLFSKLHW